MALSRLGKGDFFMSTILIFPSLIGTSVNRKEVWFVMGFDGWWSIINLMIDGELINKLNEQVIKSLDLHKIH